MKKLLFFAFILVFARAESKIIDRFSLNLGSTYSTQLWHEINWEGRRYYKGYKFGFSGAVCAEKHLSNWLSLRAGLGFMQKGFKDNQSFYAADGTKYELNPKNLNLNYGVGDLMLKFHMLKKSTISPYFLLGLRANYLLSHNKVMLTEIPSGLKFSIYDNLFKGFRRLNYGETIGIGMNYRSTYYLEFEYNRSIGLVNDDTFQHVKDICFNLRLGVVLGELL